VIYRGCMTSELLRCGKRVICQVWRIKAVAGVLGERPQAGVVKNFALTPLQLLTDLLSCRSERIVHIIINTCISHVFNTTIGSTVKCLVSCVYIKLIDITQRYCYPLLFNELIGG